MKQNLTQITVVLDRSGSMGNVRQPTIEGFNEFVEGQKAVSGDANLTLIQFDSENPWELLYDSKPLAQVPKLTAETFVPRGGTPLHDAIGRTIEDLGAKLGKLDESERPEKVVVVIQTDGFENASREFTAPRIAEMINHQRDVYKWEFVFLGANQDAILTGEKLGFTRNSTISYVASCFDPAATVHTMAATSASIGAYRSGKAKRVNYSAAQRKQAMGKSAKP